MTLHRPTQRIGERVIVAATTTVSACYGVLYVAYLVLRTAGGHW